MAAKRLIVKKIIFYLFQVKLGKDTVKFVYVYVLFF